METTRYSAPVAAAIKDLEVYHSLVEVFCSDLAFSTFNSDHKPITSDVEVPFETEKKDSLKFDGSFLDFINLQAGEVLSADQNRGLAGQCVSALLELKLMSLGDIYTVIPIPRSVELMSSVLAMAQQECMQSAPTLTARDILQQTVHKLAISGKTVSVDTVRDTLVFEGVTTSKSESSLKMSSAELQMLKMRMNGNMRYGKVLQAMQQKVLSSERYIKKVNRNTLQSGNLYEGMSVADNDFSM